MVAAVCCKSKSRLVCMTASRATGSNILVEKTSHYHPPTHVQNSTYKETLLFCLLGFFNFFFLPPYYFKQKMPESLHDSFPE